MKLTEITVAQGQEVKFHEIEIVFFHEIEFMRSNFFSFFMRSKFLIIIRSLNHSIFHKIKIKKKRIIRQFRSHDRFVSFKNNHEIESSYAQMANN